MHVDDLEQVVDLHSVSFGHRDNPLDDVRTFYQNVFARCLDHSFGTGQAGSSLVAEHHGAIVAMLLGAPTPARLNGERITGVTASLLATRPGHTSPGLSRRLIEQQSSRFPAFLYGDRVNQDGRRVAERSSVVFYPRYSLRWALVLSPGGAAAAALLNRRSGSGKLLERAAKSAGAMSDRLLQAPLRKALGRTVPIGSLTSRELAPSDLVTHSDLVLDGYTLLPDFTSPEAIATSWRWLDVLRPEGRHRRVGIWTPDGQLVGWYLLHIWPTGIAEVVQLAALPRFASRVVSLLIQEAGQLGVVSLHGSMPPAMLLALGEAGAHFHSRSSAVGIASRHAEVHDAFAAGTAYLTGLEGEYPLQLAPATNRK